ncbi:13631_t:CDS:1, partial [Acaulospora morrowiae]
SVATVNARYLNLSEFKHLTDLNEKKEIQLQSGRLNTYTYSKVSSIGRST